MLYFKEYRDLIRSCSPEEAKNVLFMKLRHLHRQFALLVRNEPDGSDLINIQRRRIMARVIAIWKVMDTLNVKK